MKKTIISQAEWLSQANEEGLQLFSHTLTHPFFKDYIEFIDVDYLLTMSNPHFQPATDNGDWANPEVLTLEKLFIDIKNKGMRDPIFMGIGLSNSMMRVETGNQRVQIFKQKNIKYIPVIAYVGQVQISHTGNGVHEGSKVELLNPIDFDFMGPYQLYHFDKVSKLVKI